MKKLHKTITITISSCSKCPFFSDHPYEPSCMHKSLSIEQSLTIFESRDQINDGFPDKCPILKEK